MGVGQVKHALHSVQLAERNGAVNADADILRRRFGELAEGETDTASDQKSLEHVSDFSLPWTLRRISSWPVWKCKNPGLKGAYILAPHGD
jgi:hypothetical protein